MNIEQSESHRIISAETMGKVLILAPGIALGIGAVMNARPWTIATMYLTSLATVIIGAAYVIPRAERSRFASLAVLAEIGVILFAFLLCVCIAGVAQKHTESKLIDAIYARTSAELHTAGSRDVGDPQESGDGYIVPLTVNGAPCQVSVHRVSNGSDGMPMFTVDEPACSKT